jgi:hypothetical protein
MSVVGSPAAAQEQKGTDCCLGLATVTEGELRRQRAMIHSRGSAIAARLLDVQINSVLTPESIGLFVEGQAFLVSFVTPS